MKFAKFWGGRDQRRGKWVRLLLVLIALGVIFFLASNLVTGEGRPTPNDGPGDDDGENAPVQPAEHVKGAPVKPILERPLPPDSLYSVKIPFVVGYDPEDEDPENRMRRDTVKEAFRFAYEGYRDHCMGQGELKPESGQCHNWLGGDLGLTVIDSLDTMLIMGHDDLYMEARDWIYDNLDFDKGISVSVFEITIRCLGGLLTAYDMTKDELMLEKAEELADRLLPAFDSSTGIPFSFITLSTGKTKQAGWGGGASFLAEMGSLQLEFSYLSHVTGNPIYAEKALRIFKVLYDNKPSDLLYPVYINPNNVRMTGPVTVGAMGDSFYEYLLKYWLLTNKTSPAMEEWYYETAESILDVLSHKIAGDMLVVTDKAKANSDHKEMEHLTCFVGGMFALGSMNAQDKKIRERHASAGAGVAKICNEMYNIQYQHLHGESIKIDGDTISHHNDQYLMRPEAVESWFYMYRLTHDQKYRDWGWAYMKAINSVTKRKYGYCGLRNANSYRANYDDVQQSWFMAETLKYLYLLFSPDDVLPLGHFVFNTEAHPLSPFDPKSSYDFEATDF
eukprot:TRINITY_DN59_c0_g2_i3.p1 TRINITY_DN59_c0_g2~~TRINITY_DN59_c0_g2_i3.p1  ORF type:complete len:561 (+),score=100.25 TRINITY_DN59_c0_g2_i3:41-1723(+)